jgi:hypothetical protein
MPAPLAVAAALAASLLLAASAHAKSEYGVFAVTVEGQGAGAWHNPVGEGCLGDGQQAALRGSMRESLTLRTARPALVTVSGLNGNAGPMRVMPLDRRATAPAVEAQITREGQVEYLDCGAPRPVTGMEGCFGTKTFATTLGIRLVGGRAALVISPPSALESAVFACAPEDQSFRPSALIPGASSLKTSAALPRTRLQRARAGTEIVLRGPHTPNPDVTGCKAAAPATCEPYAGELVVRLRFVCRAPRTGERCSSVSARDRSRPRSRRATRAR